MKKTKSIGQFLPLKSSHFHILLSLVDGPLHGYKIRRDVEDRTNGAIVLAAGTLYETLARLERDQLIVETSSPGEATEGTSRWRFYDVTELGRQVLAKDVARMEADLSAARAKLPPVG